MKSLLKVINNILFFCTVLFQTCLIAQDDFIIERMSTETGLSHDCIQTIYQDSFGFIWIATEGGLNRFDGYNLVEYIHNPNDPGSISDNFVTVIFEDPADSGKVLWIGTDLYLNKFDRITQKFTSYSFVSKDSTKLSPGRINAIYKDRNGHVWVGNNRLIRFHKDTGNFTAFLTDIKDLGVNSICEDGSGYLWLGTNYGIIRVDSLIENKNEMVYSLYPVDKEKPDELYLNRSSVFYEKRNGVLWVSVGIDDRKKLYNFDQLRNELIAPHFWDSDAVLGDARTMVEGPDGSLWLGASGLIRINLQRDSVKVYDIFSNSSVLFDRSGIIWTGSFCEGVRKFIPRRKKIKHYKNIPGDKYSISDSWVKSFYEDGSGNAWIATEWGGLHKFDKKTNRFFIFAGSPSVLAISAAPADVLWLACYRALMAYNINTSENKVYFGGGISITGYIYIKISEDAEENRLLRDFIYKTAPLDSIRDIAGAINVNYCYVDQTGIIWSILEPGNLFQFDLSKKDFIPYEIITGEIISNSISLVFEDKSGNTWFGTNRKGLVKRIKIDRASSDAEHEFLHYKSESDNRFSLSSNNINSMCEDQSGSLWIGTNLGLNKLDPESEKFTRYGVSDGLPSEMIYGVVADDDDRIWIGTNKGLSRFDPVTEKFKNFDLTHGLQSMVFSRHSCYKGPSGTIYFGGSNGFNMFHPDDIKDNPHPPDIVITGLSLFNKTVTPGENSPLRNSIEFSDEIILDYDQNVFTFEFAALDYTNPAKNLYAYKMGGVDPDWVYTDAGRRFATYTHLDPGEYTFSVKGSNNDEIWNEKGASISILILPPWWRTNWAYTLYVLLIISIVTAVWRFQLNRLQLKHQAEIEHLQAEKYQEMDKLKSRFFANISHEFRTPLTLILGIANKVTGRIDAGKTKEDLGTISTYAGKLNSLVNQLLDLSKLEAGKMKLETNSENIIPLLKGMVLSFITLSETKKITLNFDSSVEELVMYIDRSKFEKIINNLLINAFKFTPEGGTIKVNVYKKEAYTEIHISDTGIGISEERLAQIFDRFYQADASHTREFEGTGIGLSLTKELVELHKGKISVESVEGKGTSFYVSLPLGREHLEPDEILERDSTKESDLSPLEFETIKPPSEVKESKQNINLLVESENPILLIAEDNKDVRNFIKGLFTEDYKLLEATDGIEGLEKAQEYIPDLIVSDVMMPKMDGIKLCDKLKTDERTSHIPVVLLTAKASDQDKIEGLETGADDYMMKPFDAEELKVRVKNLIEQRKKLREHFRKEGLFDLQTDKITSMDKTFLKNAIKIINDNISEDSFGVQKFADDIAMSRSQLHRKLTAVIDESPGDLIRRIRMTRAAKLIEQKFGNISEIALEVGYSNPANFTSSFTSQFGMSPSEYQNRNK